MLPRILEAEVMDSEEEARDYDAMDHAAVNRLFVQDLLSFTTPTGTVLDVGTGTAQIPIEFCRQSPHGTLVAVDLADEMIALARRNVEAAGLASRIRVQSVNARGMPFADHTFDVVMSNSIIHHIPHPPSAFAEMKRVCAPGGRLFVRDLLRPGDAETLRGLVERHAGDANAHQRQMFADSLHAALTLAEVQEMVRELGFPESSVAQTSDRHWTWAVIKPTSF